MTPVVDSNNAVTQEHATATGSSGETIESSVVSSSFQLSLTSPTDMTALRTLANDTTFHNNLQTSIAETLGVDASTVRITSVTVRADGSQHVDYEIVY